MDVIICLYKEYCLGGDGNWDVDGDKEEEEEEEGLMISRSLSSSVLH